MRLLPEWLIGEICFIVLRHLDYPSNFSIPSFGRDPSTFRHRGRHSADENLIVWRNNCDHKARTNDYLGLSSDSRGSFRKTDIRRLSRRRSAEFAGARKRAREASTTRLVGKVLGSIQGCRYVFGAAIEVSRLISVV